MGPNGESSFRVVGSSFAGGVLFWIAGGAALALFAWWFMGYSWGGAFLLSWTLATGALLLLRTGLESLRTVTVDSKGMTFEFLLRRAFVGKDEIAGAKVVGPDAFRPASRLFYGCSISLRSPCRMIELGVTDVFGGIATDTVVVLLKNRRPVGLHVERPSELADRVARLAESNGPAEDAIGAGKRSELSRYVWVQFLLPAVFILLCVVFAKLWLSMQ